MKERLIIFTRYPEPGKAKTRLIPVLGAIGAANLHRQMTEQTISKVKELQSFRLVSVEVYFAGNNQLLMQDWLGSNIVYQPQSEGNLGCRMAEAFRTAFTSSMDSVIIIGTDCPGLDAQLMREAFEKLASHELVLGPATDGGYYLIGLRRLVPELFAGINWGTSEVLQQTVSIAEKMGMAIAYLPPLSDIDRPEDLSILDARILDFGF